LTEKRTAIIVFLLLSLLLHLFFFFHYRDWKPALRPLAELKDQRPEKEEIPVQIIELPPQKKETEKPEPKPEKPRFLADRNQRAETETRLPDEPTPPVTTVPSAPAKPAPPVPVTPEPAPAAPKPEPVPAAPKPAPESTPETPPPAMGEEPISTARDTPRETPPSRAENKTSAAPAAPARPKLFPSYDELTQIARESARRYHPTLPQDIDEGRDIELNTEQYDFHSYYMSIKRKIELVWEYPVLARESGIQGQLGMRFIINRDGSLADAKVMRSSGMAILDQEALRAVRDAAPYPPLPARMEVEQLVIDATFVYRLVGKMIR
jgi:protein TonB